MIELLAPAGNFDALKAAVNAGANAVYLAGSNFGARAYAENFSGDNLRDAVKFAHLHNVAIHVTTNTILNDGELENFAEYIKFLRSANVDALLVQDLGAAKIIKSIAPEIPLHASTQMTVHNLAGVEMLADLGFSRVVLARELTLTEIENIAKNSPIETEIFVHGALCVCFSGQCLMSSMIGGRSGNRGRCAQPCRLPYTLVDSNGNEILKGAGEYLLSPKDLNTLEILPRLVEAGVDSLKIEGRMKRAEYVATVVKVYRDALDKNFSTAEDSRKLAQIFNRDFTTAYLEKNPGKNLISVNRPNNRGVLIGRVTAVEKNKISIKLTEKINIGDQIEIWVKGGGRVTFTVEKFKIDGDICTVEVADTRGVKIHDRAFKIFDAELISEARKFFTDDNFGKIPVAAVVTAEIGKPLTLMLTDGENEATAETNFIAEVAKNRPLNFETLFKQISRLGNSVFELVMLKTHIDENLMVPLSELNEVRRAAVEKLENLRLKKFTKSTIAYCLLPTAFTPYRAGKVTLVVQVDTLEKIKAALDSGADSVLYGGENFCNRIITVQEISQAEKFVHSANKKFYLATPRIVRNDEIAYLEEILNIPNKLALDAIYVHNLGTLQIAKKISAAPIRTDFSLIVFNSETINFLKSLGVEGVTLSPELTLAQVKNLAKISCLPVECIVHGRAELMISAYCALGSFLGNVENCPHVCRKNKYFLRDRKNILFPVVTDQFCRMHILNSKVLSMIENRNEFDGVARIRIDGRFLTVDELAQVVRAYKFGGAEIENFTRGHYFRGAE
ncbi:MAG: DUF3656 domain-containing protein [Selenomonadaceae bacterium]|nr:DUF3656 domain-containing protein [Selenomonadaceae bacterium]